MLLKNPNWDIFPCNSPGLSHMENQGVYFLCIIENTSQEPELQIGGKKKNSCLCEIGLLVNSSGKRALFF